MALAIQHIRPVLEAVKQTLVSDMPAALAQVNAQYPDPGLLVPAEGDYRIGGDFHPYAPLVDIAIPTFDMNEFAIGNAEANLDVRLVVAVWSEDPSSAEALYLQGIGYVQALLSCLLQPHALGPNAEIDNRAPVRGAYAFNPEQDERGEWLAKSLVILEPRAVDQIVG
jgi:hypothetical protein